ncbi:MAG: four helix bundle protein [Paludibacter sp.]|jgi:four helix bundle protein|nr:four helix bundle protein [Paludibacter sp.]
MAGVHCFEDLIIWQKARELCKDIHRITKYETFSHDYKFKNQINSSSGSVMDNIAEGFERNGNKEFIQFLYIAKGSCGEVRSQLWRAYDFEYIKENEFDEMKNKTEQLSKNLSNFIQYLQNSEIKGTKFKQNP